MIEQKKKLRLDELKVDSFVTTPTTSSETIKGGTMSVAVVDCVVTGVITIWASIANCSQPAYGCPASNIPNQSCEVVCGGSNGCNDQTGGTNPTGRGNETC